MSALPPELVFSPTGRRGGDGGGSGEGDLDRGVGSPGRVADELAMRHHQHHGRGGGAGGAVVGESHQQLSFPDVLQVGRLIFFFVVVGGGASLSLRAGRRWISFSFSLSL